MRGKQCRARREVKRHTEVAGKAEEIGRVHSALFADVELWIPEIAAVKRHVLNAGHHRVGNGVADGVAEKVVAHLFDYVFDRIADGLRKLRIGLARNNRLVVLCQKLPVCGKLLGLRAKVVHHPE